MRTANGMIITFNYIQVCKIGKSQCSNLFVSSSILTFTVNFAHIRFPHSRILHSIYLKKENKLRNKNGFYIVLMFFFPFHRRETPNKVYIIYNFQFAVFDDEKHRYFETTRNCNKTRLKFDIFIYLTILNMHSTLWIRLMFLP